MSRLAIVKAASPTISVHDIQQGDLFAWDAWPGDVFICVYEFAEGYIGFASLSNGDTWTGRRESYDRPECIFRPIKATLTINPN